MGVPVSGLRATWDMSKNGTPGTPQSGDFPGEKGAHMQTLRSEIGLAKASRHHLSGAPACEAIVAIREPPASQPRSLHHGASERFLLGKGFPFLGGSQPSGSLAFELFSWLSGGFRI